jgi:hypothetical protein
VTVNGILVRLAPPSWPAERVGEKLPATLVPRSPKARPRGTLGSEVKNSFCAAAFVAGRPRPRRRRGCHEDGFDAGMFRARRLMLVVGRSPAGEPSGTATFRWSAAAANRVARTQHLEIGRCRQPGFETAPCAVFMQSIGRSRVALTGRRSAPAWTSLFSSEYDTVDRVSVGAASTVGDHRLHR